MPETCAAIVIAAKHGELIKVRDYSGITDTIGALRCKFEFRTNDWDNATMTAVFCKGNMATNPEIVDGAIGVLLDSIDECAVPAEVLTRDAKYFSVGVWGVTAAGFRIVSKWLVFRIEDGCYVDATEPIEPTPTVYEQIMLSLQSKAPINHEHNDIYYTKTELEEKIANGELGGEGSGHTHDNKTVLDKFGFVSGRPVFNHTAPNTLAYTSDIPADMSITDVHNAWNGVELPKRSFLGNQALPTFINLIKSDITAIPKFSIAVVDALPTENISNTTVYLVKDTETDGNLYTEYIYINEAWEKLGTQSIDIDFSKYYTRQEIDEKGFLTAEDIPEAGIIEETDPTVPDWAKQPNKPGYTAEEVGALPANTIIPSNEDIKTEVETALAEAKASGEFKGDPGDKGESFTYEDFTPEQLESLKGKDGDDGYTPQKGIDYFDGEKGDPFTYEDFTPEQLESLKGDPYILTEADKAEIKDAVLADVPTKTSQLENDSGFITAEDIPEIPESDFSQFIEETVSSVNLYAPTTEGFTNNAMITSNGTPTVNETTYKSYFVTPDIPVVGGKTYTVKPTPWAASVQAKNRARAYDGNGTPLEVMTFTDNADGSSTFTVPTGAETIKLTIWKTSFGSTSNSIDILIENFNKSFMFVEGTTAPEVYEPYGKGGYRLKDIEIPEKSVSLSKVDNKDLPIFAPLAGKKIANFGDSIFGNARPPEDVSTHLAKRTGAEVLNCAFGGCRMSQHVGHWDAFSMYRLAYAIANNDYSLQDEALNYDDRTSYAEEPLALIKATDFSTVDILTIGYGTNDFTGNNTLDNSENPLDTSTVCGALRYSIEQLLTAYPNLRIVILSLTYRFWADDNNVYTEDSNSRANGKGDTILNYNAKLKEVAEEYNLPFIDNYNIGIGKFNRSQYFSATDGTHHQIEGRKLIAERLAGALNNVPNTTPSKTELVKAVLASLPKAEEDEF